MVISFEMDIPLTQLITSRKSLWGGRPRPRLAPWPARGGRTRASAAVQGDRPTVRPKQVLAESRGYPPRVISGRSEYLRCPQIPRNLKSEIPVFSPLFVEQLIELALLVFVEDAQDSSLAIAEHVTVIDSEIV